MRLLAPSTGPRRKGVLRTVKSSYGFIEVERNKCIFVHFRNVEPDHVRQLLPGRRVSFEVRETRRGIEAVDVTVD